MNTKMQIKRLVIVAMAILAASLAGAGLWVAYAHVSGNIHMVEAGALYRSGQLAPQQLQETIRRYGIKSVINLRGEGPGQAWYEAEKAAVAATGAQYSSLKLSANNKPAPATVDALVEMMRHAPRPLLIHCNAGADRTGLAAALYEYSINGQTPAQAAGQLSFYYGHFPWLTSRSGAMDSTFADYVAQAGHN